MREVLFFLISLTKKLGHKEAISSYTSVMEITHLGLAEHGCVYSATVL